VLDGGLPAWWQAGLPMAALIEAGDVAAGDFQSRPRDGWFCDAIAVYQRLNDKGCVILDARSAGRFAGRDPEPRPGLRGGHMPNARNLPFAAVLNDIHMKPVEELRKALGPLLQPQQQLITSCGSGLTACILTLAAALAGHERLSVYDGSWSEWGLPSKLPVVTDDV
jgi:thiosulfate/3-mercaptopyruvate sulfurtransferase